MSDESAAPETVPAPTPIVEEADVEKVVTEQPVTEEPASEEPASEEPVTEQPATEEVVTEEPNGDKSSKNEEILLKLEEILDNTTDADMKDLTVKSVRNQLVPLFGDEVLQYKSVITEAVSARLTKLMSVEETPAEVEESGDASDVEEEDDDDEEVAEEESDDDEHPQFSSLPDEWKAQYEDIVWVRTSKSFPWWPCLIYNPSGISKKLKAKALKTLGKKQVVYYYGYEQFDFALPKQMKPFTLESVEEMCSQKMNKAYSKSFAEGVELAKNEIVLPKEKRAMWNHVPRKRAKKKVVVEKADASTKSKVKAPRKPTKEKKDTVAKKAKKEKKPKKVSEKDDDEAQNDDIDDEEVMEEDVAEASEETEEEEFEVEDEHEMDEEDDDYDEEAKPKKSSTKRKAKSDKTIDSDKKVKKRRTSENGETKKKKKAHDSDGTEPVKKKKKPELTEEEKEARKKANAEKKKKKAIESKEKSTPSLTRKDLPLTAAQKKKLLEEKNMQERNRINQMKNSNEPLWKQNLAQKVTDPPQEKKEQTREAKPSASSAPRPVETKVERAQRLAKLIDVRIKAEEKKGSGNFETDGIIKIMRKAKDMELTLKEWADSNFIELVNNLRKYPNSSEIASEAKEIRSYLKNKMTTLASAATEASSGN